VDVPPNPGIFNGTTLKTWLEKCAQSSQESRTRFKMFPHVDADGLAAASIICRALNKMEISNEIKNR